MRTKITDNFFIDLSLIVSYHYNPDGDSTLFLAYVEKPVFVMQPDSKALRDMLEIDFMNHLAQSSKFNERNIAICATDDEKLAINAETSEAFFKDFYPG